jgi:hypothetical protein
MGRGSDGEPGTRFKGGWGDEQLPGSPTPRERGSRNPSPQANELPEHRFQKREGPADGQRDRRARATVCFLCGENTKLAGND